MWQDQVSRGVNILSWLVALVTNVLYGNLPELVWSPVQRPLHDTRLWPYVTCGTYKAFPFIYNPQHITLPVDLQGLPLHIWSSVYYVTCGTYKAFPFIYDPQYITLPVGHTRPSPSYMIFSILRYLWDIQCLPLHIWSSVYYVTCGTYKAFIFIYDPQYITLPVGHIRPSPSYMILSTESPTRYPNFFLPVWHTRPSPSYMILSILRYLGTYKAFPFIYDSQYITLPVGHTRPLSSYMILSILRYLWDT